MIWFIIYITGSIFTTWLLARRIGKRHDPKIQDSPEHAVAYSIAFLGSWISILFIIYGGQNYRKDNKNTES